MFAENVAICKYKYNNLPGISLQLILLFCRMHIKNTPIGKMCLSKLYTIKRISYEMSFFHSYISSFCFFFFFVLLKIHRNHETTLAEIHTLINCKVCIYSEVPKLNSDATIATRAHTLMRVSVGVNQEREANIKQPCSYTHNKCRCFHTECRSKMIFVDKQTLTNERAPQHQLKC